MARKILLADDSVTAQNMGRKILTDAGYDVITVNNGSAALKRVAEQKPDLIVLDVYMPGYSGLEVCVRLKDAQETARIPILLTVGKLEPFKPDEATRVRADGFIVKPFEASELLSALARLEDRMVPAQNEGGRFGGTGTIERFGGGDPSVNKSEADDSDTGWKNRLRFPSKKKKEETEPEPEPDFVTPSNFRDFRRGGLKSPAGSASPTSTAPGAQPPVVVPDIPRDITPEELDALSELAAKLDHAPAPETTAPVIEKISVEAAAAAPEPQAEAAVPEAVAAQTSQPTIEAAAAPAEARVEAEVPVPQETTNADIVEARLVASSVEAPPPPVEAAPVESAAPEPVVYKTETAVAQEPAPIDREDEPRFATAPVPAPEPKPEAEFQVIGQTPIASAESPAIQPAMVDSRTDAMAPSEEPKGAEAPQLEEMAAATAPAAHITSPESQSPSSEELAEALRFLTPSQTPEIPQTLAEAGAALADELARGASGRWIAEAVPLSPEEASGSLEAEMFRTFAPSSNEASAGSEAPSVIESSVAVVEPPAEPFVAAPSPAEENSAPPVSETASTSEPAAVPPEESCAAAADEAPEEPAATTFADAISSQEVEPASADGETATKQEETETQHEAERTENGPGSEESMAKETKGKGGKSNWHQIRSGAPAGANDATEAAKQSEEAPKTMAAAAATDGGSDASSIASIVDSVLADLRPKIVEEIARQLAKK